MADWKLAANTFIWHSPLDDKILEARLPILAEWGFDAVELPLENPGDWDPRHVREILRETGLTAVVGAVFAPGRELTGADESVQQSTAAYVRAAIDAAEAQGSTMVIGPAYTSVGRTWRVTADQRRELLHTLRENYVELAAYAGDRGVRLALEPLNRYETSLFNTTAQLLEFIEPLDPAVVGLNLDTYHMNIEERSFSEPLKSAGNRLFHLQVCGNDRGAPGGDLTRWDDVFDALVEIDYSGLLGIESFTADNASIATAASIWRALAATQDDLAVHGLRFLQEQRARLMGSGDGAPDARARG